MELLRLLAEIRSPAMEQIFKYITLIGDQTLIIAVICIIFWCANKELAYKAVLSLLISGFAVQVMKISFRVERPWIIDPGFKVSEAGLSGATGYSFPSGHSQCAAALFGASAQFGKKIWIKVICLLTVAAVGFSRMYLGVHTLADVITGIILTLAAVFLVSVIYNKFLCTAKYDPAVSAVLIMLSVAAAVYPAVLLNADTINAENAADCIKFAGTLLGAAAGYYIERRYVKFNVQEINILLHIVKIIIGLAGVAALEIGIKSILGAYFYADFIRYSLIVVWALAVFPWLWMKLAVKLKLKEKN